MQAKTLLPLKALAFFLAWRWVIVRFSMSSLLDTYSKLFLFVIYMPDMVHCFFPLSIPEAHFWFQFEVNRNVLPLIRIESFNAKMNITTAIVTKSMVFLWIFNINLCAKPIGYYLIKFHFDSLQTLFITCVFMDSHFAISVLNNFLRNIFQSDSKLKRVIAVFLWFQSYNLSIRT